MTAAVSLIIDLIARPRSRALALRFFCACCGSSSGPFKDRPRIGDSATRREEFVRLGQDPFMEFPASNICRVLEQTTDKPLQIFVKFLGLLGPQGALPLVDDRGGLSLAAGATTTPSRASSTCSTIASCNCSSAPGRMRGRSRSTTVPNDDRFVAYIGSMIGIGSEPYRDLDSVPDAAKLGFAGLIGAAGEIRLAAAQRCIGGLFDVKVEIDEFVGTRLVLEPERPIRGSAQAQQRARRRRCCSARSVFSVQDKIRDPHLHREPGAVHALSADRRPVRAAGRPRVSSTSASSSSGMSNWRFRPARSSRCGSASSGSSAGRAGWRRTGPRRKNIGATRGSIRPSACEQKRTRSGSRSSRGGDRWPTSALKPSPASSTASATKPSSRRCARPRARATATSSWRTGSLHILQQERTDIALTADHFKLDRAKLLTDIAAVVDGFRKNETEMPGVSNTVIDLLDRGWHYATLFFGETQIRTGHLLVGGAASRSSCARALTQSLAGIRQDQRRRARRRASHDLGRLGGGEPAPDGRLGPARRRYAGRRAGRRRRRARPRSIAFRRI